ncbi:MAG: PadR family transcriptional regulator [Phycisphaerae bacterium]
MVLSDLSANTQYGYRILRSLRAQSAGRVDLKAGTLYPILHKLERDGCVRSWWDDSGGRDRKWYALTDKGRRRLEADAREWLDYAACVRGILRPVIDVINGGSPEPAASGPAL